MSTKQLHGLFLLLFLLLSVFLTLGRVGTAFDSFALLTPDLGVYASLAAAQESPDLFLRDPFLANPENINSYNMIYVPLIQALKHLFGNYGTACAFLLPFFIFIHLTGYYVLGVSVFKNPWAGLLVSLLLSVPVLTLYDYWGLILDALPRFLYQGLIPFLLALSIWRGHDPKWWPVLLGGVGLLNYVHPLSTPAWAAALVFALWVSAPTLGFWQKTRNMALAVLVLLLVLSPFVLNYVQSTVVNTSDTVGYEEVMAIVQARFPVIDATNPMDTLGVFLAGRRGMEIDLLWYFIWSLGILGLVYGLVWRKGSQEYPYLRQLAAWMVGILLVSGFVPMLETVIFTSLRRIPPELELVRTLRYLVPLILLAAAYTLWMISRGVQKKGILSPTASPYVFTGLSVILLLAWGISSQTHYRDFRVAVRQNLSCFLQGKLVCPLPPVRMDFIDILNVVRGETPVGARIFSEGQEVAVRYYALRPLAFTYKDGAPLAYTDQKQLLVWNEHTTAMEELAFIRKFPFRHRAFVREILELAQDTQADYLLLQEPYNPGLDYPAELSLVYTNANYSLYKLQP